MELSGLKFGVQTIQDTVSQMPASPGVYKMMGASDKLLYVGKAKNLPKRVISYANYPKLPNRLRRMVSQIVRIEYILTQTEAEALLLEANLIQTLEPIYNIRLTDDKSFPYIHIEGEHEFPRITKYRGNKRKNGWYYGPFASASQVKVALLELQKVFMLRPCTDSYFASRERPCIQYEIKRCSAPCVGKITQDKYKESVQMARDFLSGKSSNVHEKLISEMEALSKNMQYEQAAVIRDRISALTSIQAKNTFSDLKIDDADLIVASKIGDSVCIAVFFIRGGKNYGHKNYFYENAEEIDECDILETFIGQFYQTNHAPKTLILSHICEMQDVLADALTRNTGSKIYIRNPSSKDCKDLIEFGLNNANEALRKHRKERIKHANDMKFVADLFGINHEINRIEVYDNSHISGEHAVGCMVVYTKDGFTKSQYRKFKIRSTKIGDDYDMLREVLRRRIARIDESNAPDLLLIDGGKAHLSVAMEILKETKREDLNVVCISKGPDRNAGREYFHQPGKKEFQLPKNDDRLKFLQILRDEVHRYAITTHRSMRSSAIRKSSLDLIPGIGSNRKRMLLRHFGSYEGVLSATVTDLTKVNGISKSVAEKIFNYLHPNN